MFVITVMVFLKKAGLTKEEFSELIRLDRYNRGLSLVTYAKYSNAGVSASRISEYEHGRGFPKNYETLMKLVNYARHTAK